MEKWIPIISTGLNLSILIIGFKVIRQISQIEFKVNLMWTVFERKFGKIHLVSDDERKSS
jgi:hypothetical protein